MGELLFGTALLASFSAEWWCCSRPACPGIWRPADAFGRGFARALRREPEIPQT